MKLLLINGQFLSQTSYLLVEGKNAIAFDMGVRYSVIKEYLDENDLTLEGIFVTHAHFDHALGVCEAQRNGVKIYASKYGELISNSNKDLGRFMGVKFEKYVADVKLEDGEEVETSLGKVKCVYTPGHTVDGMTYVLGDYLFGGDTLCAESYGRVDFPTGNMKEMISSLGKIFDNYPEYYVLHGHEDNPFYRLATEYQPKVKVKDDRDTYQYDLLIKRDV
ncbi:MAG: MBL fold metallo-hydrolase [Clostridia bacterium]|nr:MBL fold metallo-hydrolase [Clostridia bacterium]